MNNVNFIVLIILYGLFFLYFMIKEIRNLIKNEKVYLIDFFKLFYIFIYGLVPIGSLIAINSGEKNDPFCYLESSNIYFKYAVFALSTVFYCLFDRVYLFYSKKIKFKEKKQYVIDFNSPSFYVANMLLMVIGWIALILYTRAYGSIFGIFKYASRIRDSVFDVDNKLTFFQPLTTFLIWTSLHYIVLLFNIKGKTVNYKITTIILSLISFFGYFVVIVSLDGRMLALTQILVVLFFLYQKLNINLKSFLVKYKYLVAGIIVVLFILLFQLNNISGFIRNDKSDVRKVDYNPIKFVSKEFGYTYVNNINILDRLINQHNVDIRIDDDILAALTTYLPRRYKYKIATTLYQYNTMFIENPIGQQPTDVITGSFYSLSYFGYLLFILWIPFIIYICQSLFDRYRELSDYYKLIYAYFGCFVMFRLVAYYDVSMILYSCFALIVSYIILLFFKMKKFDSMNNKIYKLLTSYKEIIIYLNDKGLLKFVSDEKIVKYKYEVAIGKKLNLDNPLTYNEKLQWLKLYDHKPVYTIMVDKVNVKDYVANVIGKEYVIPTISVYDHFDDINFSKLPNRFVIKCSHDSGGLVICKNKKNFDIKSAKEKIEKCLKRDYFYVHREWPYKDVRHKILIEEYLEDKKDKELRDYKFFCFDGIVKLMFVASNRQGAGDTYFDFFDRQYNHLDIINGHPNAPKIPHKPKLYNKMIELAEKLSKDIPHVRVDFYEVNGKVYFGEMTFFHWSGFVPFEPDDWDKKIGDYIILPKNGD